MKPLRLKAEVAKRPTLTPTSQSVIAKVHVDSGVYHLDKPYDYSIPDSLFGEILVGVRVQVPFNGREVEGLVINTYPAGSLAGLKPISKILSGVSVASRKSLELIDAISTSWAAHPYDVIRSAVPPRVAAVDREEWVAQPETSAGRKADKQYLQLPPYVNPFRALMDLVAKLGEDKSILIVFPDSKSIERFALLRPDAIVLDSSLERSTRYRNFLRAKYSVKSLVIGSRSAIFADIPDLDTVIIFDEGSEHLYEQRSPGWNARDVGLIRADLEGVHFIAIGYSPSANLARMIEDGGMRFRSTKSRVSVDSFQQEFQELLPGRIIPAIRSALRVGPVLVLATRKGYSQAISCSKCRNIALCSCGARLFQRSATSIIECSLCENTFSDWSCSWCNGKVPYLLSRGTTRFAHEIGKALPGVKVVLSEGESPLSDTKSFEGIVIATPGSAPYLSVGYAAVVVLDADKLLTQSDLKAQERAEQLIFSQTGFLRKDGKVLLVITHSHPLVGAISAWKPSLLSQRQLADRKDVLLPPFAKSVSIDISSTEVSILIRGLEAAKSDGRLTVNTRILGPTQLKGDLQRVLLLAPLDESQLLVSLIHEYQRRRSASKKALLAMRIDPYSLTK